MNSYHLPHATHLGSRHNSQYSPSTQSADISRLLDPSYASPSSSASYSQTKVYVDHNGLLHDPDYRDFPIAVTDFSKNKGTKKRTYSNESSRPSWQLVDDLADDDDEDSSPSYSSRQSAFSRPRYPSPSTSPSSYSSAESWLSSDSDDFFDSEKQTTITPKKLIKCCRRSSFESTSSSSSDDDDEDDEYDEHDADVKSVSSSTCKDTLKKEWTAMALTVQVGVFRMKKRVKQALVRA